jgi:hypothetical protein
VVWASPAVPLTPIDRRQFDYCDLDHWMARMGQVIRQTRRALNDLATPLTLVPVADRL